MVSLTILYFTRFQGQGSCRPFGQPTCPRAFYLVPLLQLQHRRILSKEVEQCRILYIMQIEEKNG